MWNFIKQRWQFFGFGLFCIFLLILFNTKTNPLPDSVRNDPKVVEFHFKSWIPRAVSVVGQMGAITLGHDVHFKYSLQEMDPCRDRGWRNFIRHELWHLKQYEESGPLNYYLGYMGNSFGAWLRNGFNWQKAYTQNSYELAARGNENVSFTSREMAVITRYWPHCTRL